VRILVFLSLLVLPILSFGVDGDLRIRVGVFGFTSRTARKIYGGAAPDIELQGDFYVRSFFNPWINVNYVWKEGKSEGLKDKTYFQLGTLSIGFNLLFPHYKFFQFYIGPGFSSAYLHTTDRSNYLPKTTGRFSVGVVGKGGFLIPLYRNLVLDLFFDYYYQPVRTRSSLSERQINVGGFRTGGGLGWKF